MNGVEITRKQKPMNMKLAIFYLILSKIQFLDTSKKTMSFSDKSIFHKELAKYVSAR